MKEKITGVVYALFLFWLLFLMFVGVSWGIGYYSNAINKSNWYDLSSCMFGISTAGSALGSILALVVSKFFYERERTKRYGYRAQALSQREIQRTKRYDIDSKHNSPAGTFPTIKNSERKGSE